MASQHNATTINTVRVRANTADPHGVRARMASVLAQLEFTPPGLPASALLCVRTLHDPSPRTLSLNGTAWHSLAQWQAAAQAALGRMAQTAARPAREAVPASTQAVLFADRAEMLACLAQDWCAGQMGLQWWWPLLLGRAALQSEREQVVGAWHAAPECAPLALALLAQKGMLASFINRWRDEDVRVMVRAVLHVFGLRALHEALQPVLAQEVASVAAKPRVNMHPQAFAHVAPEALVVTRPAQQCLVGVALMMQRAPALIRSTNFADVLCPLAQRTVLADGLIDERPAPPSVEPDTPLPAAPPDATQCEADGRAVQPNPALAELAPQRQAREYASGALQTAQPDRPRQQTAVAAPAPTPPDTAHAVRDSTAALAVRQIETRFGGVFYLFNVALSLGLYADFTAPLQPGLELNVYDFLALVGAQLAGDIDAGHQDAGHQDAGHTYDWHLDAIGPLLAELAGHANEAVAPEAWPELLYWLPIIRKRLQHALGASEPGFLVCQHNARVEVSAMRLDIFLSLDTLPIEIRLCGLDRDPGWIPAAGRFVAFHFD